MEYYLYTERNLDMSEKLYNGMTVDEIADKVADLAKENFKIGLTCSECVFKAWLDMGFTDYPPEVVGLASGMGGGMGESRHTCGALNGGMLVVSSRQGRKNPLAKENFEERVAELHDPDTGVYPKHFKYVQEFMRKYGTTECRDLCQIFDDFDSIERKRNCKAIIMDAARIATKAAFRDNLKED